MGVELQSKLGLPKPLERFGVLEFRVLEFIGFRVLAFRVFGERVKCRVENTLLRHLPERCLKVKRLG